jgi:hypothetical protein
VQTLGTAAIIGTLVVLPFMLLELFNRRNFSAEFPFPLFLVMWLLSASFVFVVTPPVRNRAQRVNEGVRVLPRVVLVAAIAWMWLGLVADQMPCFLGVPNCD